MKYMVLALAVLISACTAEQVNTYIPTRLDTSANGDIKQVVVLGRTWAVSPMRDQPGVYTAKRDNNNNNPFGKPVARRTPQAIRAIEMATGCKVVRETMKQDITARFFAAVVCKS